MRSGKAVEKRLNELAEQNGGLLLPEHVVDDAKKKTSPLHNHFEWDNNKAGHAWRLEQARVLIRSVKIKVTEESVTVRANAYVQSADDGKGYKRTEVVRQDPEEARRTLKNEIRSLWYVVERVQKMAAALGLKDKVEMIIQRIRELEEAAA